MNKIEEAKQVLREVGYFVDNLWHTDDVTSKFSMIDNKDAQYILEQALTGGWVMEVINNAIVEVGQDEGFKLIEE